jgi:hypothetical protein
MKVDPIKEIADLPGHHNPTMARRNAQMCWSKLRAISFLLRATAAGNPAVENGVK